MRDFTKLKELSDWETLDAPIPVVGRLEDPYLSQSPGAQSILRMLVKPKYGWFSIPQELKWLTIPIMGAWAYDGQLTGIGERWCYVTVRSGPCEYSGDDEWHFDGGSVRTELIPERNYVWVDKFPFQYRMGSVKFPDTFDPCMHNMFDYANHDADTGVRYADPGWNLVTPFCFHRRDPKSTGSRRTFIRITFADIEIRDEMCTQNPMLRTEAFGRNPARSFRDELIDWPFGVKY